MSDATPSTPAAALTHHELAEARKTTMAAERPPGQRFVTADELRAALNEQDARAEALHRRHVIATEVLAHEAARIARATEIAAQADLIAVAAFAAISLAVGIYLIRS